MQSDSSQLPVTANSSGSGRGLFDTSRRQEHPSLDVSDIWTVSSGVKGGVLSLESYVLPSPPGSRRRECQWGSWGKVIIA